ncbi:MAG: hypothetical protein ABII96_09415 [Candidatus Zixiibacteriota bacterium]
MVKRPPTIVRCPQLKIKSVHSRWSIVHRLKLSTDETDEAE